MAKKISIEELVDWWLVKYHGITYKEAKEEYDKEEYDFLKKYAVTQEQHDEWAEWFENFLMKKTKMSIKNVKRNSWGIYLDAAPMVKENKNE